MVLLHSAGNTGAQWDALADHLDGEFSLFAPDLYDCGRTAKWTHPRAMSYDDHAALLAVWMLDHAPVHLVGHSFGGGVALRLAALHPDWLRSLTLIEPGAYQLLRDSGNELPWLEFLRVLQAFRSAVADGDLDRAWEVFFDSHCSHLPRWPDLPEPLRRAIRRRTPEQLRVYEAQESNPVRLEDIRRLTCPTLVIRGQDSDEAERTLCALIASLAPQGCLADVPGARHMLALTHAGDVARLLRSHLTPWSALAPRPTATALEPIVRAHWTAS